MSKTILTKLKIIHCPDCGKTINAPMEACIRPSRDPHAPIFVLKCPDCGRKRQMMVHALPLCIDHANVVFSAVIQLLAVEFLTDKPIKIEEVIL